MGGRFIFGSATVATAIIIHHNANGTPIMQRDAIPEVHPPVFRTAKKEEATSTQEKAKDPPNPNGAKGKQDHQDKVQELAEKAKAENPGKEVIQEKKIKHPGSNRRPDVQVVDENGNVTQVHEAERKPNSPRNKKREAEYD